MIIGNPKVRSRVNTVIDSFCVALFFALVPFAIACGTVAGALNKLFSRKKGAD